MATDRIRQVIEIDAETDGARREIGKLGTTMSGATDDVGKSTAKAGGHLGTFAKAAAGAFAVGAVVEFGRAAVGAFTDAQASMARSETMLDRNNAGWRKHRTTIDAAIQKHMELGAFDDEELYASFANLARVTGDTNVALERQQLAMDIARAKGISLESATNLVAKAHNGQTGALRKLGLNIDKNTTSTEALAMAQRQFGGQAETYGNTAQGQAAKLQVAWGNVQEQMGELLLPAITAVMQAMVKAMPYIQAAVAAVADWFRANWPAISEGFRTAGRAALGLYQTVEPVLRALLAVIQAVVGWVVDHWDQISTVVATTAKAIRTIITTQIAVWRGLFMAVAAVVEGIIDAWKGAVGAISKAVEAVRDAVDAALTAPLDFAGWLGDNVVDPIKGAFGRAKDAGTALARSMWSGITGVTGSMGAWVNQHVVQPVVDAYSTMVARGTALAQNVWTGIRSVAGTMAAWLSNTMLEPIGRTFGTMVDRGTALAQNIWTGLRGVGGTMGAYITDNVLTPIGNKLDDILGKGRAIAKAIADGMERGAETVVGGVKEAFRRFLNGVIRVINLLPFVSIPEIKPFAEGGIVRGPTYALVGEDGPEVVVPLSPKRRERGRELLGQAASWLGMPGNLGEPSGSKASTMKATARALGMPMFGLGGFILDKATSAGKAIGQGALDSLPGQGAAKVWEKLSSLAKGGASALINMLPALPTFSKSAALFGKQLAGGVKDAAGNYLRGIFQSSNEWGQARPIQAMTWARNAVATGSYLWGGGHGGWDFTLPKGYDCSGFASHAAKAAGSTISAPGTTGSTLGMAKGVSTTPGNAAVLWGWRGMDSADPRRQHMGIRIMGNWFSFGPQFGDSRWDWFGVPPGLPGYALGTAYVPNTGPAILHAGEAVLDRQAAAAYRAGMAGGTGGVQVVVESGALGFLADFIRVSVDDYARDARRSALAAGAVR